ncbi:hypothetical protein FB451DRAFT_1261138 [Mycena latifolia]|nr:hypothetical protein FB451DRAFT_1261138 [Mycena latifolia]
MEVQILRGTTGCDLQATRSQIVLAWVFLIDHLSNIMEELERLCSTDPFSRSHHQEPSRIPQIVSLLSDSLYAEIPASFFDWHPLAAKTYSPSRSLEQSASRGRCGHGENSGQTESLSAVSTVRRDNKVLTNATAKHPTAPAVKDFIIHQVPPARTTSFVDFRYLTTRTAAASERRVPKPGVAVQLFNSTEFAIDRGASAPQPNGGRADKAPPGAQRTMDSPASDLTVHLVERTPSFQLPAPALVVNEIVVELGRASAHALPSTVASPEHMHATISILYSCSCRGRNCRAGRVTLACDCA